jgi:phosphatidate cytidylyltransferase
LARAETGLLRQRIQSALVLAPVALLAVWAGGVYLSLLVAVGAAGMGWEWGRLCGRGRFGAVGLLIVAVELASLAVLILRASPEWGLLVAVLGALAVAGLALATGAAEPPWAGGGTLWIAAGVLAFHHLGAIEEFGRYTLLWLLALVWATDTAAYFTGRRLGGPRLAPRLSPNKTWSGFAGGLGGAALVGFAAAWLSGGRVGALIGVSLCVSIASQAGDLLESLAKRHYGVKDTSQLIPGHGGLLDRLDSLLAAAMIGLLFTMLAGGATPLQWR